MLKNILSIIFLTIFLTKSGFTLGLSIRKQIDGIHEDLSNTHRYTSIQDLDSKKDFMISFPLELKKLPAKNIQKRVELLDNSVSTYLYSKWRLKTFES